MPVRDSRIKTNLSQKLMHFKKEPFIAILFLKESKIYSAFIMVFRETDSHNFQNKLLI